MNAGSSTGSITSALHRARTQRECQATDIVEPFRGETRLPERQTGAHVRVIGNILWLVLAGIWMAAAYVLFGIIACILVITIPFGIQSFKLAGYALWPFGRTVVHRPDRDVALSGLGNVIWFVIAGLWLAIGHVFTGILLAITIIGIPLAIGSFKMAGLALFPFGKQVVPSSQAAGQVVHSAPEPLG